jgi:hypothetical protein
VAKDLEPLTGLPIAPYVALFYSGFERRFLVPAGATIRLGPQWFLQPTYDGHSFHPMLTYQWDRFAVTGILIRAKHPGIAFTVGF